jgi:hypothetical protein
MRSTGFLLSLALAMTVPACAGDDTRPHSRRGGPEAGEPLEPRQLLPAPAEPNFVLFVSNQSFDIDPVDIGIFIDDELVVEGDFLVGSQHSWHRFDLALGPGKHTVLATSSAGDTERVDTIELPDAARYAVINFWYYPASDSEPYGPTFSFDVFEDPPGFD